MPLFSFSALLSGAKIAVDSFHSLPSQSAPSPEVGAVEIVGEPRAPRAVSRLAASARGLALVGALALGLLGFHAPAAHAGAVRPDPVFNTNTLPPNDDGSTGLIPLGFTINFFGVTYNSAYVNNNGNITFKNPLSTFTPFNLTSTNTPIIAPFFADVDTRGAGSQPTRYGQSFGVGVVNGRPAFGVNYINVGYFSSNDDKLNSFQVVLIDRTDTGPGNFDIELNFDKIQWETGDASGGNNGLGGNSARVGFSNGTGISGSFFELQGSAVNGAFLDSNPITGLIYNSINSDVPGRYYFQVRDGIVVRTLSIGDATVTEGNSGLANARFVVTLAPASDQAISVDYATQNVTAITPQDYISKSGTLTFAPNTSTQVIEVPIVGDLNIEDNEIFFVNLSNTLMRPGNPPLGDGRGVGTILNDDNDGPPTVSNFTRTVTEDNKLSFAAANFEAGYAQGQNRALQSVRVDTLPANGTLVLNNANVTVGQLIARNDLNLLRFFPNANFNGSTSFRYNATDGTNFAVSGATVAITVDAVNDNPTISAIADQRISQDTSTRALSFTIGDMDTALEDLTISATSSNDLFPAENVVLDGSGANRTITVTPAAGRRGRGTITIEVSDGVATTTERFLVTVTEPNIAPALRDAQFTGTRFVAFSQQLAGSDANRDALSYSLQAGRLPDGLSLSGNGLISGTPTQAGNSTAVIAVSDGQATTTARVRISIDLVRVGGGFIVDNQTFTASLNRPFSIALSARGRSGATFSFSYGVAEGSALPAGVNLSSRGVLSGTPLRTGSFGFDVRVSNGSESLIAHYVLVVTDVADGIAPIITRDDVATPVTRDQLNASRFTGKVRDIAPDGVTASGVKRMFVQLRRNSDGFAYNRDSGFTSDITKGYFPVILGAAGSRPDATRNWRADLSFVPSLGPGDYVLSILAEDNAGNVSTDVVVVTIVAPIASDGGSGGNS